MQSHRFMHWVGSLVLVCCALSASDLVAASSAPPQSIRNRPAVMALAGSNKTLVADSRHALLRGVRWSTDLDKPFLPPRQWITDLKNYGVNALHVYAEAFKDPSQPGAY